MPLQFQPLVLGAMLLVAVGTAVYTIWNHNRNNQNYTYDEPHLNDTRAYDYYSSTIPSSDDSERRRRRRKNELCSICLDTLAQNTRVLPCGHIFHQHCIRSWLVTKSSCPNCRLDVS